MPAELFYFTGTGNSLAIAKRFFKALDNVKLTPIPSVCDQNSVISKADIIGIINPVYYICAPDIVIKFLHKVQMPNVEYLFFALTRGIFLAHGAATQMKNVLKSNGYRVNAAWYFTMDQTYLPVYTIRSKNKRHKLFQKAYDKVDKAVTVIQHHKRHWEWNHADFAYKLNQSIFFKNIHNEDKKFYLNDRCRSCGVCEQVCPVDNIIMKEGRPHWLHRCESCQACVHFCPRQAIEVMSLRGKRGVTEGKERKTHPEITVADMLAQKGEI